MGAAAKDDAKMMKARADLDGTQDDIDAFLTSANPNLSMSMCRLGGGSRMFIIRPTRDPSRV